MKNNLNLLIVGCGKIAKLHARILKEQFKQHQIYCIDKNTASQKEFIDRPKKRVKTLTLDCIATIHWNKCSIFRSPIIS